MNYAGFWIRFGAEVIDFVLLNGLELALEYGISKPLHLDSFAEQGVGLFLFAGISYWYYCRYQVKHGTTVGKRLFGVYVINEKTGATLTHGRAVARMFSYLLSYAIVGCGFLMAAFHPRKQALHDVIAGTLSIRREPISKAAFPVLALCLAALVFGVICFRESWI